MAVPSQPRPRAATEPGGFTSEVPRAAASQVQRPRITSAQLREIGTMLQRLTRENAALIQARDAAQAALEPLTEELRAARATLAAAEAGAGAAARQAAAQEAAAAEAGQELARLRIGQRKATTDKERLTAEVSGGMGLTRKVGTVDQHLNRCVSQYMSCLLCTCELCWCQGCVWLLANQKTVCAPCCRWQR